VTARLGVPEPYLVRNYDVAVDPATTATGAHGLPVYPPGWSPAVEKEEASFARCVCPPFVFTTVVPWPRAQEKLDISPPTFTFLCHNVVFRHVVSLVVDVACLTALFAKHVVIHSPGFHVRVQGAWLVRDACRATCAAPFYFAPFERRVRFR
jgi:hypothetical protein